MALSGTLTGSCVANNGASSRYDYKIEWSATQNVSANTSTITATAYVRSNNSAYSTSTNWTSIINGSTVKTFTYHVQASAGWVNFGSKIWTVNHNADGSCTTSISGSFSGTYNGSYVLRSGSVSGNITLNTIPRASSFTLNRSSATIGSDQITVNISRASSSFTHTVIYKFGSISWTAADKTSSTAVSFTPAVGDSSQIPNATSGTATIVVDTYNGSSKIGTASRTITLNVPSSAVPTIGSVGLTGNNLLGGVYVAGKSTVTAKINSAAGSYGSTIKSYHLSGGGLNIASSSATSGTLSAGTHTITGKVTDSRGRTASKTANITVHSYASPTLSANVYRANSSGQAVDEGTYVRASITVNVSNVGNANVNAKQYKIEKKTASSSSWTTHKDWTTLSNYAVSWTEDMGAGWLNTTSYDVRISIKDSYTTVSVTRNIGTIVCVLNIEQTGVGIGKIHERGALDISGITYSNGSIISEDTIRVGNNKAFYGHNQDGVAYSIGKVATHGGIDLGDTRVTATLCSANVPKWWNGSKNYNILTKKDVAQPGNWFNGGYVGVGLDGTLEIGKYIDFHNSNTTTSDYDYRLTSDGGNMHFSGGALLQGHIYLNSNTSPSTNGFEYRVHRNVNGNNMSTKIGMATQGGGSAYICCRNETAGTESTVVMQSWGNASGTFRPYSTGIYLGSSDYKWHVVYSNSGTINTSDERRKAKLGYTDLDDCYNLIKNIDVYNYIMIDKDKTTLKKNRYGQLVQEAAENPINVRVGVMAQDLEKFEVGKRAIVKTEVKDEATGEIIDYDYGVNPYDVSMVILGALQKEIQNREELEERVAYLEELLRVGA